MGGAGSGRKLIRGPSSAAGSWIMIFGPSSSGAAGSGEWFEWRQSKMILVAAYRPPTRNTLSLFQAPELGRRQSGATIRFERSSFS